MTTRRNTWNATFAAMLLLLTAGSAAAQGWGGMGFSVGGQKIQFGGSSRNQTQRSSGRVSLPAVISGSNSRQSSGLQRVINSAASGIASESLRQVAPALQRTIESTSPQIGDRRYRPESGGNRLRLDLAGFKIEHAAALATAIAVGSGGGGCVTKNPFCGSRPVCPPSTRPICPTVPVGRTPEQNFDLARKAFRNGDYAHALAYLDRALQDLPNEADLHQFRSLILFAQGEYPLAAESAYTALSAGPGWNWNTLYGFYGDADLYTEHLHNLAAATKANPESPAHHFLLGYHYLMLNHVDAGRKQLELVLELQPEEPLTKSLLELLPPAE